MKAAFSIVVVFLALCILYVNTEGKRYTYAEAAEKWANEECAQGKVRELRFFIEHGERQITLKCHDGTMHFWDGRE
jgi:hypothetical protein